VSRLLRILNHLNFFTTTFNNILVALLLINHGFTEDTSSMGRKWSNFQIGTCSKYERV